jgi:hypothetical protein
MPLALLNPDRPAVEYGELSSTDADALRASASAADAGTVVRIVRGSRSRTAAAFFDELSAALQLPGDSGANWAALTDVLRDFALYGGTSLVLIVIEAEQLVAADPDPLAFLTLLDVFTGVDREAREEGEHRVRLLLAEAPGALARLQPRVKDIGLPVALAQFTL